MATHQAHLSMEFSRQEYWSRLPFPSPEDLPDPAFKPGTSIESVMPSSHLILCHSLFLLSLIPPSIRVFSNDSILRMRWPKYWNFSFSIIPSKEIPGLISFIMDWLDLLGVQGTLKNLLQHHSSKASILRRSAELKNPSANAGDTGLSPDPGRSHKPQSN